MGIIIITILFIIKIVVLGILMMIIMIHGMKLVNHFCMMKQIQTYIIWVIAILMHRLGMTVQHFQM